MISNPNKFELNEKEFLGFISLMKGLDDDYFKNNFYQCLPDSLKENIEFLINVYLVDSRVQSVIEKTPLAQTFFKKLVMIFPHKIEIVPKKFIDYEMGMTAVKVTPFLLAHVPVEKIDYEMCLTAVKIVAGSIIDVPEKFKTPELCLIASKESPFVLKHIPLERRTLEICELEVNYCGSSLEHVPEELRNFDLCLKAVQNDKTKKTAFNYVSLVDNPSHEETLANLNKMLVKTTIKEIS